jgi:putative transposase
MTEISMTVGEYLRKAGIDLDGDFLAQAASLVAQATMELEVTQQIGAAKHERTPARQTQRNGYRERSWATRAGDIPLRIPKLRQGSYFPSLLEPRRQAEQALLAVVQQAYIEGVSTRKVGDLLQAYVKVRVNHRIVSQAVVMAIGVRETGERALLGFAVGASEDAAFWLSFLRSLVQRGLRGVQLVISDSHEGLKAALSQVLAGATWQRCRVHFMRNVLAHIPQGDKSMVAAALRTFFAQPNRQAAGQQLQEVVRAMMPRWPKAAQLVAEAEEDILAYMAFPLEHWTRIYSTNPLERLNKEVKRRTNVVGVFPDEAAVVRLIGALLLEQADEWEVDRRYFSQESMRRLTEPEPWLLAEATPFRLAPIH